MKYGVGLKDVNGNVAVDYGQLVTADTCRMLNGCQFKEGSIINIEFKLVEEHTITPFKAFRQAQRDSFWSALWPVFLLF